MKERHFLTQKELAAYLGVNRWTVWYWYAYEVESKPKRIKIGKRYYYPLEAVREWLEASGRAPSASGVSVPVPGAPRTTAKGPYRLSTALAATL